MTDREVMQIALDALSYHTEQTRPIFATDKAIAALTEALAAPQRQPLFGEMIAQHPGLSAELAEIDRAIDAKHGCAAPQAPQPAQEHVGIVESALRGLGGFHARLADGAEMPRVGSKLYTTPQAPQPLTDEQIEAIFDPRNGAMQGLDEVARRFARAIEAAHGITSKGPAA